MAILSSDTIHATSIAIGGRGVLIMGPSGAGKSDLALRLIDRGAALVSDDSTVVIRQDRRLLLRAPSTTAGKMEIRHLGIVELPHVEAFAALVVRLSDSPERMPDQRPTIQFAGIDLPLVALNGREPSAPIKLERALDLFGLHP
jgi:HPr kinase/phosphorylase